MAPLEASDAEGNLGRRLGVATRRRSEMAKRKKTRRNNNPHGRPSSGLAERVLLAVSPWMAGAMRDLAVREGVSASEMWRAAAWRCLVSEESVLPTRAEIARLRALLPPEAE